MYQKLELLMLQKGVNASTVAKESGVGKSTLSFWKKGIRPKLETMQKIAIYFGVDVTYFLEDETTNAPADTPIAKLVAMFKELPPEYQDEYIRRITKDAEFFKKIQNKA